MSFWGSLFGQGKSRDLKEIALELAARMDSERSEWCDACARKLTEARPPSLSGTPRPSVSPVEDGLLEVEIMVKAFQLVHALSFAHARSYVKDIGAFTRLLCQEVCGDQLKECTPWMQRYTEAKMKYRGEHFPEQFIVFSDDVALTASRGGSLLAGPIIDSTVIEFWRRNLRITALTFRDKKTSDELRLIPPKE